MKEADTYIEENGLCRLFSYFNDKSNLKRRFQKESVKGKLFVDSGAFTAWTKGISLDVDEYINWLNTNEKHIHLAGQIDCIPGKPGSSVSYQDRYEAAEKTWQNYLYMRSKLNNPDLIVYTFHLGEDYSFLERALEQPYIKYIALGGTVGSSLKDKKDFFIKCFSCIRKSSHPEVKVHAFGMTSFSLIEQFPFYSVDSTSWIMTGCTGGIFSDWGIVQLGEKSKKCLNSIWHLSSEHLTELEQQIQKFGYTVEELSKDYKARELYNIKYLYNKALTTNISLDRKHIVRKQLF